jgi:hypothetical protein
VIDPVLSCLLYNPAERPQNGARPPIGTGLCLDRALTKRLARIENHNFSPVDVSQERTSNRDHTRAAPLSVIVVDCSDGRSVIGYYRGLDLPYATVGDATVYFLEEDCSASMSSSIL